MRRTGRQQRAILAAMVKEARRRTEEGLPIREVRAHVAQVRRDLTRARRHGFTLSAGPEEVQSNETT